MIAGAPEQEEGTMQQEQAGTEKKSKGATGSVPVVPEVAEQIIAQLAYDRNIKSGMTSDDVVGKVLGTGRNMAFCMKTITNAVVIGAKVRIFLGPRDIIDVSVEDMIRFNAEEAQRRKSAMSPSC